MTSAAPTSPGASVTTTWSMPVSPTSTMAPPPGAACVEEGAPEAGGEPGAELKSEALRLWRESLADKDCSRAGEIREATVRFLLRVLDHKAAEGPLAPVVEEKAWASLAFGVADPGVTPALRDEVLTSLMATLLDHEAMARGGKMAMVSLLGRYIEEGAGLGAEGEGALVEYVGRVDRLWAPGRGHKHYDFTDGFAPKAKVGACELMDLGPMVVDDV
jgi:hypothetical protein